jgi:hypothetical protein
VGGVEEKGLEVSLARLVGDEQSVSKTRIRVGDSTGLVGAIREPPLQQESVQTRPQTVSKAQAGVKPQAGGQQSNNHVLSISLLQVCFRCLL